MRGDLEAIEELLDPEVEFHNPENAIESGVRRGRKSFLVAVERLHEDFEYSSLEPERMVEVGDQVVVALKLAVRGKGSGVPIGQRFGHVWKIRAGKVVRFEWFMSGDEAFEAAGIASPATGSRVALLRRGYEALERGDFETVRGMVSSQIEVRDRPESPDAGVHHGRAGLQEVLDAGNETFEQLHVVPERFVESGDQVAVVVLLRGHGRGSGVPVEERIGHLWTFVDEEARLLQVFTDPGDALAAVGADR
jgi:ketosteroid isomerase-like protein